MTQGNEQRTTAQRLEIKNFYDGEYYARDHVPKRPSSHLRRLAKRLELGPGQRVLDVACGRGEWLLATQECGCTVAGIDLSDRAVASCQAAMPGADIHQGPAEKLPWPDQSFDLVSCLGSLEHFLDPVSSLKEMVRVATPVARYLLLVPNSGFLTRRLGLYRGTNQASVREVVRSLNEWSGIFEQAGLDIIERWKDLHVLSADWIFMNGLPQAPVRALQAAALAVWPLSFQYQVYHLCRAKSDLGSARARKTAQT